MGVIKKQSIQGTILSYIGVFIAFLNLYIQPHLISNEDIGTVRLLLSMSFLISSLIPLGIGNIIIRYFPLLRDPKSAHNGFFGLIILVLTIGSAVTSFILLLSKEFFVSYYANSPGIIQYYNETIATGVIIAFNVVLFVFLASLQKTAMVNLLNEVFIRVGQLVLIIIYHFEFIPRDVFVWGNLGLYGIQFILIIAHLRHLKSISFNIRWSIIKQLDRKQLFWYAFFMAFTTFTSFGIKYIDQLMIGHFLNEERIAIYSTSILMVVVIEIPFRSLEKIAQPMLAQAWTEKNMAEIAKLYEKSSRYMFFLGSAIACILWTNCDLIFNFLPPEYSLGKISFYIMTISSLLNMITGLNSAIVMLSNRYYIMSLALIVLMVSIVVANNTFIPAFGISGAALATLLGYSIFNLIMFFYNLFEFKLQPLSAKTVYIFLLLCLIALGLYALPSHTNIWVKGIVGSTVTAILFISLSLYLGIVEELNTFLLKLKKRFIKI